MSRISEENQRFASRLVLLMNIIIITNIYDKFLLLLLLYLIFIFYKKMSARPLVGDSQEWGRHESKTLQNSKLIRHFSKDRGQNPSPLLYAPKQLNPSGILQEYINDFNLLKNSSNSIDQTRMFTYSPQKTSYTT